MNSSNFTLRELVRRQGQDAPDSPAYVYLRNGETEESRLSFAELDARARAQAAWLQRNAKPGDRAVLAYPAGLEFITTFLACAYARLIPVPVALPGRSQTRDASGRRLTAVVADCNPSLLLSVASAAERLPATVGRWQFPEENGQPRAEDFAPAESESTADEIAFLQYTSGSTGKPKGVVITHRALYEQLEFHRRQAEKKSAPTIFAGWLPHHHDFGLVGFHLGALYLGSPYVFMSPATFLQRPARWLEMVSRYRATYSGGPNFGYELCANAASAADNTDLDLSSWLTASVGGEAANPATLRKFSSAFEQFGFRQEAFLPTYGLAEAVLCVAARQNLQVKAFDRARLQQNQVVAANGSPGNRIELVAYGQPLEGHEVRIVNPESRAELAANCVGEIWLRGQGVAAGYWRDAARSRALFQAALAGADGAPHLRTGDYGFIFNGELYVTGRLKDVIIVRGNNHSPDDLEATIRNAHEWLELGGGAVFQVTGDAEPRLVAVQEVSRKAARAEYRQIFSAVAQAVAEHHGLRLNAIVLIRANSIPRTTSGKVRRRECRELFLASKLRELARWDDEPVSGEQPEGDEIEATLLEHLQELLPQTQININDNIFSHGCDSLTVQRFLARIHDSFQVSLSAQTLYAAPTVSDLSRHIRELRPSKSGAPASSRASLSPRTARADAGAPSDPITRLESLGSEILHELRSLRELIERQGGIAAPATRPQEPAVIEDKPQRLSADRELTATQREIRMFEDLYPAASSAFARVLVLQMRQPSDRKTIYQAFREVANRHDALRTALEAGQQRVLPYADPDIRCVSLPNSSEVQAWLREERQRGFDLARAPLWRVRLLTIEQDSTVLLVITAHALIADNWSLSVIAQEFARCWSAINDGKPCALPQTAQFGTLCEWENKQRDEPGFSQHQAYLTERIGHELAAWEFPADEPRPQDATYEAGCHSLVCDGELRAALLQRGGQKSATLFQTLLAAYFVLLHRYTGQDRLLIGVESSARNNQRGNHSENFEAVIGCCSRLTPVVIDFSDPRVATDVQRSVRDEVAAAIEHQPYTLAMLAEELRIPFDPQQPVLTPVTISMCSPLQAGDIVPRFDLVNASITHSPFALALDARDLGDSLRLDFTYNKALLGADIAKLSGWYIKLLEAIAQNANLLDAQILDDEEQRRILAWGAGEVSPVAARASWQSQFETQAAQSPEAIAAICGKKQITYDELNRNANKLAWQLAELGEVARGVTVGILCSRNCDYLTTMVATLKAGFVCLSLDPAASLLQTQWQSKQASVCALCFSEEFRELAGALVSEMPDCRLLSIQAVMASEDGQQDNPPPANADAPAFLIAAPEEASEMVMIGQRGLLNHLRAKINALQLTASDVVAQSARQSHYISIWQFLSPLLIGAAVRIIDEKTAQDAGQLITALAEGGVTVLQEQAYVVRDVLEIASAGGKREKFQSLKALRWLVATGEPLPADLCRRWISYFPRSAVLNGFSSASCSDVVTQHTVIWPPPPNVTRVPIGRPIPGAEVRVLNRRGQMVPAGTPGELCVGGYGVIRYGTGSVSDLVHPESAHQEPPGRSRSPFRTGALVRFRSDGTLEYLGDLRKPLTIGGWRVHPGEVESALRRSPSVLDAAVNVQRTAQGEPILVAYVSLRKGPPTSVGILRALARNVLPQRLVPSAIVFVERLPRTGRGAIDWSALPEAKLAARLTQPTPPATAIEEELARIWREELKLNAVGVHDDLFELGGSSLLAARIAARIGASFDFRLPVAVIFRAPTVAGVASYVEQQLASLSS